MTVALPPGWAWVRIGDLVATPKHLTDGPFGSNLKTEHYRDEGPRVIRLQNVGDGEFLDDEAHITVAHFNRLRKHEVVAGDVIVAMLGLDLPRACMAPPSIGPAIVKADCVRLRADTRLVDNKYVVAALNSPVVRRQAEALVHGVGRPRLGLRWFRTLRLPLAPVAEQARVVDALESLNSRLDAAVATLERAQSRLKAYRASVLTAAVEGRLVPTEAELARNERRSYESADVLIDRILQERRRRWEEAELARMKAASKTPKDDRWKAAYEEPVAPNTTKLPNVPQGWRWTTIDAIAAVKGGITKGQKRKPAEPTVEVPYLRVANVQRGYLDLTHIKTIHATPAEVADLQLERGDVLFNEGGDRDKLGRGWVWGGEIPDCIHQNHVFRARLIGDFRPRFVSWYANSNGQAYFFGEGKQTTNLASINMTKLKALPVPCPPLAEQDRILDEVERLLSVSDAIAALVAKEIVRCKRLRDATLMWAFEGKLVNQDHSDEPAEVLLARVRSERTAATEVPRKPRTRKLKAAS